MFRYKYDSSTNYTFSTHMINKPVEPYSRQDGSQGIEVTTRSGAWYGKVWSALGLSPIDTTT
jgi:hypothetical protein